MKNFEISDSETKFLLDLLSCLNKKSKHVWSDYYERNNINLNKKNIRKLRIAAKSAFWFTFSDFHKLRSSKLRIKDSDDILSKLKQSIFDNSVNIIPRNSLRSGFKIFKRTSFIRYNSFKKSRFKKRRKIKIPFNIKRNSVNWIKDIASKFIPFTFKKFYNQSFFVYKNNNYWRIKSWNKYRNRTLINYFVQIQDVIYKWPLVDSRRRKQRFMALAGYKMRKYNLFSNFKLRKVKHRVAACKFLRIYNNVKINEIDLSNYYAKFSSLIFKELVMLFFFWIIYYLSSFYFLYFKVLKRYDLFLY